MKTKIIYPALTIFLLIWLNMSVSGQAPVVKWTKQYPAQQEANAAYTAEKILETSDGFVICGSRSVQVGTNPSTSNVFVLKIDKAGAKAWLNNFDIENPEEGFESNEYAYSMVQNDLGNFYIVGYQSLKPLTNFVPARPRGRVMVLEIMADGTFGRNINTTDEVDLAEGLNICKTINKTYVITGRSVTYDSQGHGGDRILLGEFTDQESDNISFNTFPLNVGTPLPSVKGLWATSIVENEHYAPYMVAGTYIRQLEDIFLMNVDDIGWSEWILQFDGEEGQFLKDVIIIGDYYYLVGYSKVPVGQYLAYQVYVVKTEPFADINREKWQNTYGGSGTHYASAAFKADDGNLIVIGYTYAQDNSPVMVMMKIDAGSGDLIWREDYAQHSSFRDAIQTTDFDYLLAGKAIYSGVPSNQMLLMYLGNSQGTTTVVIPHWAIGLGLVNTSDNIDIVTARDLTDNLYGVSVTINELLHPDVSNLEIFLEHGSVSVKLVARNTASGVNFINTNFSDLADNPVASGSAPYTGSFLPAESLHAFNGTDPKGDWTLRIIDYSVKGEKSTTGTFNAWTLKLLVDAGSGTGIHSVSETENSLLYPCYPNPAHERTQIVFKILNREQVNLTVYNQSGQVVEKLVNEVLTPGEYTTTWEVNDNDPGVYFVRLELNGMTCNRKLVVLK